MYHSNTRSQTPRSALRLLRRICTLLLCLGGLYVIGAYLYGAKADLYGGTADAPWAEPLSAGEAAPAPIAADGLSAQTILVVEAGGGAPICEKAGNARIAPASTAKLVTALTVLAHNAPETHVTVGPEITMIAPDSSIAYLCEGDILTVRQLLIALLLPSGNDAAYTLAVHTGRQLSGDPALPAEQAVAVFVDAMNRMAAAAGAVDSNFCTPDGYDADGQYTTAADLARIAAVCLENADLAGILGSHRISETWPSGREVTYYNSNELLSPESPYYRADVIGLKTGTSGAAGSCLISAAVIDGRTYISVVMGAEPESRFSDSLEIYSRIAAGGL